MYILVRESVPLGFALVASAHASLACYLKFREAPEVAQWLAGPFFKAVCKVSDAELERAKEAGDWVSISEAALEGQEVAVAFRPRAEWPKPFRFLRLYR